MLSNNALFKRILLVFTAILLAQCTKVAESRLFVNQPLTNPYTMPAATYLSMARNQTGYEQQSLNILAAGRLISEGQWQNGLEILSQMGTISPDLMREKNCLLAKIELIRQKPKSAIAKLALIHQSDSMPLYYQVQYHEMLATAYRTTGNIMDALNERVKLEKLLPDESSQSNNHRALWLMLTTLPAEELNSFAAEAREGSVLGGWIQLAVISRTHPENVRNTIERLNQWKSVYPTHPANAILPPSLARIEPYLFAPPGKIALLLPLTGRLAGPANAIRDGFMQASRSANLPINVQLYDTDKASASTLYQQAIDEGADYVVGPLGKADVNEIASINHPVPTLLLNDIDNRIQQNAYQFGLSPTNEARQVAARARKNGYTRALVIAPAGQWGEEVSSAFARQWQASGGRIVDSMIYSDNQDIASAVKGLLHASEPKRSKARRGSGITTPEQTGPLRRQDFDMIFLLAYPSKARQIMPMLRYYFAGNVPVYATSAVYSGSANPQKDRDLNGILFCDIPWVFNHQQGNQNWPEQWNSYNRLYALGMDSFILVTQLNQLFFFPAMGVSDHSGALYLSANQRITRILAWGRFQQGLAQEVG